MPINPNIAMGFQAPQIESPMNMMAQMMQMKSAQEGSQLNALKLQQAQREVEQQNMLGQAYQSAFDPQTGKVDYSKLTSQLAGAGAGAQIPGILKGQRELESADVDAKTKKVKLLTDTLSTVPEMYKMASTPDDFLAVHQYVHSDPVLGPWLKSIGATPEKGLATLQAASQTPEGLSQYKNQAMSSVNQILESSKPLVVAPSASVFVGGKFQQAPSAPEKPANAFAPLNAKDFTPESIRAFVTSQNPADLVAAAPKPTNAFAPINVKDYTPESLKVYGLSGEVSDLVPVPSKADKPASLVNQIDASKFTPASVAAFSTGGDYSLLVPVVSTTATAAPASSTEMKNADAFALLKGPLGSPAYNAEFAKQLARLTAKTGGGEGGGGAAPKAPIGYRFTKTGDLESIPGGPAAASEGLAPKEIQKREAALPQARQSVKSVSNIMSVIGQTVDSLLANPNGIDGITGLVYGITPAITGPARKAKAELDQLKNLAFIQGITELRAASKTGAAVGNVSNREGDRFENLKASLDRQQDKDDLIAALKKLKQQAELTSQFMTEAFDETYSYKSGGAAAPAAAPGRPAPAAAAPNIDALLNKYK
jgi:hypothetical protein